MQKVEKKKPRQSRSRWMLLGAGAVLLCMCIGAYALISRPDVPAVEHPADTYGEIINRPALDVARLRITLRSGESWTAVQSAEGILTVEGEDSFDVQMDMAENLLSAARIVSYEDVFTDDPAVYTGRLAEFGLETPRAVVEITYADGETVTLRLGDPCLAEEERVYYMTVDGDDRLLALDRGTAEHLITGSAVLRPVTQPALHKARFDRITFTGADGATQLEWALQGEIGSNAADRWLLTYPDRYPADGEKMTSLLSNLANIRLGAYVAEATADNLALYGLDAPRFTVEIHQAEGTIGSTDEEGRYGTTLWPEDTFTLAVGAAKSDSVDYVMTGGKIYISSHYSLQTLMNMEGLSTVSRYPVPVALGNLARLTVATAGHAQEYVLTREMQNGEAALPEDEGADRAGTVALTRNGETIPYAGFEAAYNRLLTATVSGKLPRGWTPSGAPHTTFTFEDVTGVKHVVSLSAFDALHDAVTVDGCTMFYMISGGLAWEEGR